MNNDIVEMMEKNTAVLDTLEIGYQIETKTHIYRTDKQGEVEVYGQEVTETDEGRTR